ncbi:MAG: membrane protein insertion efficiency factor YidD [Proteobacteria bacterium]|nr:membrane protein insertion efficiency factor YidD [Pseudomonadota bacterium]
MILFVRKLIRASLIATIILYRYTLSPLLGAWFGPVCRFYPSCSSYALQCLEKDPIHVAIKKITCRLLRCHPYSKGGVDLP